MADSVVKVISRVKGIFVVGEYYRHSNLVLVEGLRERFWRECCYPNLGLMIGVREGFWRRMLPIELTFIGKMKGRFLEEGVATQT